MTDPREECFTKLFDGCTCEPGQCQSFASQQKRKRNAQKTVEAKYFGDQAFSTALAFLFVFVLLTASFFLFAVPEGKRLGMVHQEQVAVR